MCEGKAIGLLFVKLSDCQYQLYITPCAYSTQDVALALSELAQSALPCGRVTSALLCASATKSDKIKMAMATALEQCIAYFGGARIAAAKDFERVLQTTASLCAEAGAETRRQVRVVIIWWR